MLLRYSSIRSLVICKYRDSNIVRNHFHILNARIQSVESVLTVLIYLLLTKLQRWVIHNIITAWYVDPPTTPSLPLLLVRSRDPWLRIPNPQGPPSHTWGGGSEITEDVVTIYTPTVYMYIAYWVFFIYPPSQVGSVFYCIV